MFAKMQKKSTIVILHRGISSIFANNISRKFRVFSIDEQISFSIDWLIHLPDNLIFLILFLPIPKILTIDLFIIAKKNPLSSIHQQIQPDLFQLSRVLEMSSCISKVCGTALQLISKYVAHDSPRLFLYKLFIFQLSIFSRAHDSLHQSALISL